MTTHASPQSGLRRILVPSDGSIESEVAAWRGIALAKDLGATVVGFSTGTTVDGDASSDSLDEVLEERIAAPRRRDATAGVPFEGCRVVSPDIAEEIVEAAIHHDCDLIVMSTHAREGLARLLNGSVSEKVLHIADVPVMLLRIGDRDVAEFLRVHDQTSGDVSTRS